MSWLVTGVTGLLGANAASSLTDAGMRVVGVARSAPAAAGVEVMPVDLASATARDGLVDRAGCDVVLHTAAVSSIEACERDPEAARELNTVAAADLAAQAARSGAAFVHISTDAVFDGDRGGYREDDPVSPLSVYGRTKADAEQAVLDANPAALVARVNFYGWSPTGRRSLLEFFARALSEGRSVHGFTDVRVSTLYVADLVDALVAAVDRGAGGLLHVAASESITKFDFGRRVAAEFGWDPALVLEGSSADVLEHRRGSDLSLDVSRFESVVGALPAQAASIARAHEDSRAGLPGRVAAYSQEGENEH